MANKNVYLQVEFKTGNVFEFSKEEKDGFEEHKNSKGTVTWRKYYKAGIFGIYRGSSIRESKFGKEVSIHLIDENGDNNYINLPLLTQDKTIAPYAESLITVLPSMEKDYVYRIFPYAMEKEGTKYKNYGVSVMHADLEERTVKEDFPLDRLKYSYTTKDGKSFKGDIPEIKWEESFDGSKTRNSKERDAYLYKVLEENATGSSKISNRVKGGEAPKPYNASEKTEKVSVNKEPAPASISSDKKDDVELPF